MAVNASPVNSLFQAEPSKRKEDGVLCPSIPTVQDEAGDSSASQGRMHVIDDVSCAPPLPQTRGVPRQLPKLHGRGRGFPEVHGPEQGAGHLQEEGCRGSSVWPLLEQVAAIGRLEHNGRQHRRHLQGLQAFTGEEARANAVKAEFGVTASAAKVLKELCREGLVSWALHANSDTRSFSFSRRHCSWTFTKPILTSS